MFLKRTSKVFKNWKRKESNIEKELRNWNEARSN
jgi:hypothetical protein